MANRSPAFTITNAAYTKIGDNVTTISARETAGEPFYIVIVDVGDPAPLVGETNRTTIRGLFYRNARTAFDCYALGWDVSSRLEVQI
jgi:hypothetical protein